MFVYNTYAAKPHSYGDKDLNNLSSFVALRRDNEKLETALKPLFLKI